MKSSAEIDATIDELGKHGAEYVETVQGRKHARVFYKWKDKTRFMVCAVSGSDFRGPANARQAVRHALGIERGKKVGKRRQHKERNKVVVAEVPKLTLGRDPFTPFRQQIIASMSADQLWALWFAGHLRACGHEPVHRSMRGWQ